MTILALKLILVPTLIAGVTLAGRRVGPLIAGALAGFPIVMGPLLIFVSVEQGREFAVGAARGAAAGIPAAMLFMVGYAWAARRVRWPGAICLAFATWAVYAAGVHAVAPPLVAVAVVAVVSFPLTLVALPRVRGVGAPHPASAVEVGARIAAAIGLVLAVTGVAAAIGPTWSGLLAMAPVASPVLAGFTHARAGADQAIRMLRGISTGMTGLVTFALVAAGLLDAGRSLVVAFVPAVGAALAVQVVTVAATARGRDRGDSA